MTIRGLCACVGYAPLLARTLYAWRETLDALTIVTSAEDGATWDVCQAHAVPVVCTSAFYAGGAAFNKGAALEDARQLFTADCRLPSADWLLLFDADCLPEPGWREIAEAAVPGCLYGAHRYQAPLPGAAAPSTPLRQWVEALAPPDHGFAGCPMVHCAADEIPGCFQLFHQADPVLSGRVPVIPTHWSHAGNYDTELCRLWPPELRVRLPIRLLHLGEPGTYWHGVEPREAAKARTAAMHAARRARGGWQHERLPDSQQ